LLVVLGNGMSLRQEPRLFVLVDVLLSVSDEPILQRHPLSIEYSIEAALEGGACLYYDASRTALWHTSTAM